MSDQKISAVVREALWIAYGRRCAYTHELVDLASMHVDHIVPQSVTSNAEEFESLKREYGLSATFDALGLENLLPTKAGANLQKGGTGLRRDAFRTDRTFRARASGVNGFCRNGVSGSSTP